MFLSAESGGNDERDPDARCFLRPDFPEVDDRSKLKDLNFFFSLGSEKFSHLSVYFLIRRLMTEVRKPLIKNRFVLIWV